MRFVSPLARCFFGPYELWRIYSASLDQCSEPPPRPWTLGPLTDVEELRRADDPALCSLADCSREAVTGFGAWVEGELAAACWLWDGKRYDKGYIWPLEPGDADVLNIATANRFRGRGIAPQLIAFSALRLRELGYRRLFARVWHANRPSQSAFRKAGLRYTALVLYIIPFGKGRPLRFVRTLPGPSPQL